MASTSRDHLATSLTARTAAADVTNEPLDWADAHHIVAWTDGGSTTLDKPRFHYWGWIAT